ncbi:MAG: Gfo/Idh/MocA family oxidoreductase [Snowella sp.]|nr:Gfo/Idh/MocA family oxidoreductase [Snowella sp.]
MKSVIVIGAGQWGQNLVRQFYQLQALAGVVEIDLTQQEKLQVLYPGLQLFTTLEEALESEISAFVIATPAPSHYRLAKQILGAGKDCFIEKPMTLRFSEAEDLAKLADRQEKILMVGHLLLYQPAIRWMKDYLHQGKLGKVYHVATIRNKLGKVRREENVWWSFAPHDVSVVLELLGNPELAAVQAQSQNFLQPHIADNVHVNLSFKGGQSAHIHCCWYWPHLERSTIVLGEKGMLVYDEIAKTVTVHQKTVDQELRNQDQGSWQAELEMLEPLAVECQHFLDCLETRQQPLSNGWNGARVVEILEKALEE